MKLIHTADLHLDSPIRSVNDPEKSALRRDEILRTFGRMAELAEAESADAILIAGDLFDSDRVTTRALGYVTEQIRRHPGIDFYCLRGNHDRSAFAGLSGLPENLYLFDETLRCYPLADGVRLYASENPYALAEAEPFDPGCFNIAMLHGELSDFAADLPGKTASQPNVSTLPISRFAHKNLDYLALGHIHGESSSRLDERGEYRYCGCPNGRGFDECGEKGVILLEIADGRCDQRFIPLSDRIYHDLSVDLTGTEGSAAQLAAIREALSGIGGRDAIRLSLTGERTESAPPDPRLIADSLPDYFDLRIYDRTVLAIDKTDLAGDISLRGEFLRLVAASDRSEEEKRLIVLAGLAALNGEAIPV